MEHSMKITSKTIIATLLLISLPGNSFAATKASINKPKSAGRTMADVANTILSGTTPPNSLIGINGDFYIDTKNSHIYGPKTKGKWLLPTPLKGSQGAAGVDGKNGLDAKLVPSSSLQSGTQGPQGERGATGSTGATGAQGPAGTSSSITGPAGTAGTKGDTGLTGSTGAPGATGSTGLTGPTGPSGSNGTNGSPGATGAQGSIGQTGFTGLTGDRGAAGTNGIDGINGTNGLKGADGTNGINGTNGSVGATGATGAAGPTNVQSGTFSFVSNLSGAAGSSKPSSNFGNFIGGKNYYVKIYVKTNNVLDSTMSYPINLSVNSVGSTAILNSITYMSTGTEYLNPGECLFTTLITELTIDGTGVIGNFNIQVVPMIGASGFSIAMTGKYFSSEVGQVG
jgi:hypothetical protein